jgi:hypothetical protein
MNKEEEIKALRTLLSGGKIHVNYSSTDCDGIYNQGTHSFDNIEEFDKWQEDFYDGLEGPGSIKIVEEDEKLQPEDCGSSGHGWDIN